jgi:hypothetical protein
MRQQHCFAMLTIRFQCHLNMAASQRRSGRCRAALAFSSSQNPTKRFDRRPRSHKKQIAGLRTMGQGSRVPKTAGHKTTKLAFTTESGKRRLPIANHCQISAGLVLIDAGRWLTSMFCPESGQKGFRHAARRAMLKVAVVERVPLVPPLGLALTEPALNLEQDFFLYAHRRASYLAA